MDGLFPNGDCGTSGSCVKPWSDRDGDGEGTCVGP